MTRRMEEERKRKGKKRKSERKRSLLRGIVVCDYLRLSSIFVPAAQVQLGRPRVLGLHFVTHLKELVGCRETSFDLQKIGSN